MARKKRQGSSKRGSSSKPAVLSLGKKASKRGAKTRVGKSAKTGRLRKASSKSKPRGRRY